MTDPGRFISLRSLTLLAPAAALLLYACAAEEPEPCEGDDCVEELQPFDSVRLTYLDVQYDLTQPVYINNRVPIEYGLTATSPGGVESQTAVTFSFVEASPADPAAPIECSSSAAVVELPGDGAEHRFYGYVWPTTACEELLGREVNLRVEFDGGEELESETDAPAVSYTAANRGEAINQLCVTASGESGCVYDVDLQPTPSDASGDLIDVRHAGMTSSSSVASLPVEEGDASLSIESTLVVNGRDPYIAAVDPENIPEDLAAEDPELVNDLQFGETTSGELIAMPGQATLRYELRPVGSTDDYLPLRVGAPEADERTDRVIVDELLPGTPNTLAHELFAEGSTYAALQEGGAWADQSDFEVRGCFDADFTQAGNEGGVEDASDCRSIEIVLVRETESTAAATAHEFNRSFNRGVGGSRLRLEAGLETENRLDSSGASSRVEGNVSITGNVGRRFNLDIVRALARANAGLDPAANGYEVLVRVFNQDVYSVSDTGGLIEREEDFSVARSHQLPTLGYGFGPVRIGITFRLGGEAGINMLDSLETTTDAARCAELLGAGSSFAACGAISRTTTPYFAFTASIEGGVRVGPVSGGVEAQLRMINTELPLTASLALGVDDGGAISVLGNARLDLELRLIQGNVSIVGRIRFRRRFLRRFNRTLRVTLFRFSSPLISRNLLDRSVALEVLQ